MEQDDRSGFSDSDDVPSSTGSVPEPNRVTLAKIFMSTPNPANSQRPLIAEWDGENPGHTKRLFVYAHIDNSTYESYVTLGDASHKQLTYVSSLGDGRPFHRDYDKRMHIVSTTYFQSSIHNPYHLHHWPTYPELETVLKNLMSGTLSFENGRVERDRHRIYVFDPPPTMGIEHSRHFTVSKPMYTYWYKLNNTSGLDRPTDCPPGTLQDISEYEFTSLYRIFSKFNIANHNTFLLDREPFGHGTKRPLNINIQTGYLRRFSNGHNSHRGGKKRNKTRRKYRKIKSRRRRP